MRTALRIALAAVLLVALASLPAWAAPAERTGAARRQFAVGIDAKDRATVVRALTSRGARVRASSSGGILVVSVPATAVDSARAAAEQAADIAYFEPPHIVHALTVPSDPRYPEQWGLPAIAAPPAWSLNKGSRDATIAVVDTGIDMEHVDLAANIDSVNATDIVNGDGVPQDDHYIGHGTHVSGITAAAWNGLLGVGVAPRCAILPIKVLDADGNGTDADVALGIEWAADHGADVVNLSLGESLAEGQEPSQPMRDAIEYARSKNVVVVAAAGNAGVGSVEFPAAFSGVVGVAAVRSDLGVADFSNWGPEVDIAAPGFLIMSTGFSPASPDLHTGFGQLSGTSMATAFVSGAVGLLRSEHPTWSESQVRATLATRARDLGQPGRDDHYGAGLLQLVDKVSITAPRPSKRVVHNQTVTFAGYLTPRFKAGRHDVMIRAYHRENGVWVYQRRVYATNVNWKTYTKYVVTTTLPKHGSWRLVPSVAETPGHAATVGTYGYLHAE